MARTRFALLFLFSPLAPAQDLVADKAIEIELKATEPVLEGHGPSRAFEYDVTFEGTLHVWARSSEFNPLLRVTDSDGTLLAEDDDAGGSTTAYLELEVGRNELISITVAAESSLAAGRLTLHVSESPETEATRAAALLALERLEEAERLRNAKSVDQAREVLAKAVGDLLAVEGARTSTLVGWASARLGVLDYELGALAVARDAQTACLRQWERTLPDDHPELQAMRRNLAQTIRALGDLSGARALEAKVLEVYSRTLPDENSLLLRARTELALTIKALGDLEGSRVLFEKVLEVRSRTLSDDHPELQFARQNLAGTIKLLGDRVGARVLEERALEVLSRTLPDDHPDLQAARLNLAGTLRDLGDLAGARALEEKVLEVRSCTLPDDHPETEVARLSLAGTIKALGDFVGARVLEEKVVEVFSRVLPDYHPLLQSARSALAQTLYMLGDVSAARALQERVLEVFARRLPDDHPDLQVARQDLAGTIASLDAALQPSFRVEGGGRTRFGELLQALAQALRRSAVAAILDSSSREAEERVSSRSSVLGMVLSFSEGYGIYAGDPSWSEQAFLASETARNAALASAHLARRAHSAPNYHSTRARAREASAELARMVQEGASANALSAARDRVDGAERELVRAAAKLSGGSGKELEPDLETLTANVREGEALLAYRCYTRSRPEAGDPPRKQATESLCAFVLRGGVRLDEASAEVSNSRPPASAVGRPLGNRPRLVRVELGGIEELERAVLAWRDTIGMQAGRGVSAAAQPATEDRSAGDALRALVLDPLAPSLEGVERLSVALDDVLHAVPFDALPAGTVLGVRAGETADATEPLGSRFAIEVRASLIEFLSEPEARLASGFLLALGGAEFGEEDEADSPKRENVTSSTSHLAPDQRGILRGGPWEAGFGPLAGTLTEVREVRGHFAAAFGVDSEALVLKRRQASRESLFALAPKARFLHIATHGWFAPESIRSFDDPEPLDKHTGLTHRMGGEARVRGMSPMLLCGLALAGANSPADELGRIPGLVTAEELATLDLSNCELAVLSACDTNIGLRRAGQGVASLQRAIHMAGARSVITSLWKVPDEATKDLMVDFYRRIWVEKKPKSQALWEAKMKLRNARDAQGRPVYTTRDWAAWVSTGDPR